ncbi:MAG: hypothetical protein ACO1OT_08705 [Heyndrickxia sp.]
MGKVLEGICYTQESGTIIDPMYAVVDYLKLCPGTKDLFAGMSCLAFRFSVDRTLSFTSTSLYNWNENWLATDFLGIYSEMYSSFTDDATFPLYQKKMIERIVASIYEDIPVIVWQDGFQLAIGYHQESEELLLLNGDKTNTLKFSNFGVSSLPVWYAHFFTRDRIEMDSKEMYMESLFQAVYKFQTHDMSLPRDTYACGRRVYDFIMEALCEGTYCKNSCQRTLRTHANLKFYMIRYFRTILRKMPELRVLEKKINSFCALYQEIEAFIFKRDIPKLVDLYKDAKQIEDSIYVTIQKVYQEEFANRFGTIGLR